MGYAPLAGIHAMSAAVLVTAGALLTLWLGTKRERAAAAAVVAAVWLGGLRGCAIASSRQPKETHARRRTRDRRRPARDRSGSPSSCGRRCGSTPSSRAKARAPTSSSGPRPRSRFRSSTCSEYLETVRRRAAAAAAARCCSGSCAPSRLAASRETYQNILLALTDEPQVYVKRHLVPFGEYFPVPSFIRSWMRLMNLPYSDLDRRRRRSSRRSTSAGERLGITICYEDVFGAEQLHYLPDSDAARQRQQRRLVRRFDRDPAASADRARAGRGGRALLAARGEPRHHGRHRSARPRRRDDAGVPAPACCERPCAATRAATPYARVGNYLVVVLALAALVAAFAAGRRRPAG